MDFLKKSFILIAIFLCSSSHLWAQEPLFELSFSGDKSEMTIGDELTVSIDILHHEEMEVFDIDKKLKLSPFEIKKIIRHPASTANQLTSEAFDLILTTFELGELEVPAIPVRYKNTEDTLLQLKTDVWPVVVRTVRPEGDMNNVILPIKGPRKLVLPELVKQFATFILLMILGAILLWALIWKVPGWIREWQDARRTPFERAQYRFKQIVKEDLLGTGQIKEFYSRLSETLKMFIVQEFKQGSLDLTTQEFVKEIEKIPALNSLREEVQLVLKMADFVKFAKLIPPSRESEKLLADAKHVVVQSMKKVKKDNKKIEGGAA